MFLEILQNSQENTYTRASFFIKKRDSGTGEFSEISKNTFFTEHLRTTASEKIRGLFIRARITRTRITQNNV